MKRLVFPVLLFAMTCRTEAQDISRIEYFFNEDPGFGQGIQVSGISAGSNIQISASLNAEQANEGFNLLFIRVQDVNGNWSLTNCRPVLKSFFNLTAPVAEMEYFVDEDPGFGNGRKFPVPDGALFSDLPVIADLSGIEPGVHNLFIRFRDTTGAWSMTNVRPLIKEAGLAAEGKIEYAEYFFNTDPGFGNGVEIDIPAAGDTLEGLEIFADASGLEAGTHNLYIRVRSENGAWSLTNIVSFEKSVISGQGVINEMEISVFPNPSSGSFTIEIPEEKGVRKIYVLDAGGKDILILPPSGKRTGINLHHLPSGVYFLKFQSPGGFFYKKIFKE